MFFLFYLFFSFFFFFFFFFNDTATTEIYTLSLHDALPVCSLGAPVQFGSASAWSRRIRASAKAVRALALYSTDRCIHRTALRRSLAGGSVACWATTGAVDPSATIKTRIASHLIMPFLLQCARSRAGGAGSAPDPRSDSRWYRHSRE